MLFLMPVKSLCLYQRKHHKINKDFEWWWEIHLHMNHDFSQEGKQKYVRFSILCGFLGSDLGEIYSADMLSMSN